MPCNINPNNVDSNYPIAGQDNDSQGFRDNFTNIKANFAFAKTEIEDLQKNSILKSALLGSTLNNDLNNAILYRARLKSNTSSFNNLGTKSGIVTVSFLDSNIQKITITNSVTLVLADFPSGEGIYASLRLWISVSSGTNRLVLPNSVAYGLNNIQNYNSQTKTIEFSELGNHMFEFSTVDGGTNFWITKIA